MTLQKILKLQQQPMSPEERKTLANAIKKAETVEAVSKLFEGNVRMYTRKKDGHGLDAKKKTGNVFNNNQNLETIKQKILDKLGVDKAQANKAQANKAQARNAPRQTRSSPAPLPAQSTAIPLVQPQSAPARMENQNVTSKSGANMINSLMKAGRTDEAMKRINVELKSKQNQQTLKRLRNMKRAAEVKLGAREIEAQGGSRQGWFPRPMVNRVYENKNTGIKLVKREPVSGLLSTMRYGTEFGRNSTLWMLEHAARGPLEPLHPAALLNVLIRHKRRFFDGFMREYEKLLNQFNSHASLISQAYTKVVTQELDNDLNDLNEYRVGKYFIKGQIGTTELINKRRQEALKKVVEDTTAIDPTMFDPERLFNPINSLS
jgi:hypothetical protein